MHSFLLLLIFDPAHPQNAFITSKVFEISSFKDTFKPSAFCKLLSVEYTFPNVNKVEIVHGLWCFFFKAYRILSHLSLT